MASLTDLLCALRCRRAKLSSTSLSCRLLCKHWLNKIGDGPSSLPLSQCLCPAGIMRKPWVPTAYSCVIGLKRKLLYLWNLILLSPALQRPVKQTPSAAGQGETGVGKHGPLYKGMLGVVVVGGGGFRLISKYNMYAEKLCVCTMWWGWVSHWYPPPLDTQHPPTFGCLRGSSSGDKDS